MKEILDIIKGTYQLNNVLDNWTSIIKEAQIQSIDGIICDIVSNRIISEEIETPLLNDMQNIIDGILAYNVYYFYAQDELCELLNNNGIPFSILKGSSASFYYPKPMLRRMGDIDFIVPIDKLDYTRELLIKHHYSLVDDETSNRHIEFSKDGVVFELHNRFSYDNTDIENYIINDYKLKRQVILESHSFQTASDLTNGLVLLLHLAEHLKSGVGLRQVMDWNMYVNSVLDNDYWTDYFSKAISNIGLDTFAVQVTFMCKKYLFLKESITWCDNANEQLCDDLINLIISSGNFGRKNDQGRGIDVVTASIKRIGLFKRLQLSGEHNWRAYKKHKWLKPFCWIYQLFRYAWRFIHSNRGIMVKDDISRGIERDRIVRELGL